MNGLHDHAHFMISIFPAPDHIQSQIYFASALSVISSICIPSVFCIHRLYYKKYNRSNSILPVILSTFFRKISHKIDHRCDNYNHWAGCNVCIIRQNQPHDARENGKIIEKTWYSRIFTDRFLLDAAGRISNALMIRIPTHLMESMTISATSTAKHNPSVVPESACSLPVPGEYRWHSAS